MHLSERAPDWFYGGEVAINGNTAVTGAWGSPHATANGVVHVFQRDDGGRWNPLTTLREPTGESVWGTFGWSLAAADGQIFVGSGVNSPGAVHVYSAVPEPAAVGTMTIAMAAILYRIRRQTAVKK